MRDNLRSVLGHLAELQTGAFSQMSMLVDYRALNSGATWEPAIDVNLDAHEVRVSPTNHNLVAAATASGLCVGHNAVAIQYQVDWAGKIGGQGPSVKKNYVVREVLEIVDGEVAIIRQFSGLEK